MTGRLFLVAHAEATTARAGAFSRGQGLSARGTEAAAALFGAIPRYDHAITGPEAAARETATALGIDAHVDEALRDLDLGAWAGRSLPEVAAANEASAAAFFADPTFAGHGGEAITTFVGRIARWLDARRATGGVTVAVGATMVVRAAVVATLSAPPAAFWRIDVALLDAITLGTDGRRWTLRRFGPLGAP